MPNAKTKIKRSKINVKRKTKTLKGRVKRSKVYKIYKIYKKRGGEPRPSQSHLSTPFLQLSQQYVGKSNVQVPLPMTLVPCFVARFFGQNLEKNIDFEEIYESNFFKKLYGWFKYEYKLNDNDAKKKFAVILMAYLGTLQYIDINNSNLPEDDLKVKFVAKVFGNIDIKRTDSHSRANTPHPSPVAKKSPPNKRRHTRGGVGPREVITFSALITYLTRFLPERFQGDARLVASFLFMLWGIVLMYNSIDALFNIDDYVTGVTDAATDEFTRYANRAVTAVVAQVAHFEQPPRLQVTISRPTLTLDDFFNPASHIRHIAEITARFSEAMARVMVSSEYQTFQSQIQTAMANVVSAADASTAQVHIPNDADAGFFTSAFNSLRNAVGQLSALRYNAEHAEQILNVGVAASERELVALLAQLTHTFTRVSTRFATQLRTHLGFNFSNLLMGSYMTLIYFLHIVYILYRRRSQQSNRQIGAP